MLVRQDKKTLLLDLIVVNLFIGNTFNNLQCKVVIGKGLSLLTEHVAGELISEDHCSQAAFVICPPLVILPVLQFLQVFTKFFSDLGVDFWIRIKPPFE